MLPKPVVQYVTSPARIAVETVLREAIGPMSAPEIARLAGVPLSTAHTHLGNAIQKGRAHNLFPGKRNSSGYVWGAAPQNAPAPPRFLTKELYQPKPANIRAGSEEFLRFGSLVDGVVTERKPPFLMGAQQGMGRPT